MVGAIVTATTSSKLPVETQTVIFTGEKTFITSKQTSVMGNELVGRKFRLSPAGRLFVFDFHASNPSSHVNHEDAPSPVFWFNPTHRNEVVVRKQV